MTDYIRDRRKYSRVEKSFRVEYVVDGRRSMAFAVNLSMGGMLLRSASQLVESSEVDFMLALPGAAEPLTLGGRVLGRQANQARVCFTPDHPGLALLRSYFETVMFPELESALEGPRPDTARLLTVARLYADFERTGDALQLYRSQRTAAPNDLRLLEQFSLFLLQLTEAQPPYPDDVLPELESVIIAGQAVGPSETLTYVKRAAESMLEERRRQQQELTSKLVVQQQNERIAEELRQRGEQLDASLSERRRVLEAEFTQRAAMAHAEMQAALAAERGALAEQRAAVETERLALQGREAQLAAATAAENSRTAAVFAELTVKQEALVQQKQQLAQERAIWERERAELPMSMPPETGMPAAEPAVQEAAGDRGPAPAPAEVVAAMNFDSVGQDIETAPVAAQTRPLEQADGVASAPVDAGSGVMEWISEPVHSEMPAESAGEALPVEIEQHDPQAEAVTMEVAAEAVGLSREPVPAAPVPAAPVSSYFAGEDEPAFAAQADDLAPNSTDDFSDWKGSPSKRRRLAFVGAAALAAACIVGGIVHVALKPDPVQSTASAFAPDPPPAKPPEQPMALTPTEPGPAAHTHGAGLAKGKHAKAPTKTSAKKSKVHK